MTATGDVVTELDDRTRRSLVDIVRFAGFAEQLVSRGRDAYDGDLMLQLAGESIVNRIGEATSRVSQRVAETHPDIPFRDAKDMRNLVWHEYQRVDGKLVWEALTVDVPEFAAQVRGLLDE